MAPVSNFKITFNNPYGVYVAGQTIQGVVNVRIDNEALKMRGNTIVGGVYYKN